MATNNYADWAVDLAEVGPVYPFQGSEVIMVIAGVLFWLWWHIAQSKLEKAEHEEVANNPASKDDIIVHIDEY